jgi:hypothetical protein
MPVTAAQREAMIESLNNDQFAPLDLSAFPNYLQKPATDARDDRWSRDWRDTPLNVSASALRSFVSDPDTEALERVSAETGHEDFRKEVRDRKGETTAMQFKRANPDYVGTDDNYKMIAQTLAFNTLSSADQEGELDEVVARLMESGAWTVPNLTACYRALLAEGLLDIALGSTRELSTAERLRITRLAQAGHVDQAIYEYMHAALDEEPTLDMLDDPSYRPACDAAVEFVFEAAQLDYAPTPERRSYLTRYAAGRPLTLALLQQGWASCQAAEQRYDRSEVLRPLRQREEQVPTQQALDALDDDEVEKLYRGALKNYAASVRYPGVAA